MRKLKKLLFGVSDVLDDDDIIPPNGRDRYDGWDGSYCLRCGPNSGCSGGCIDPDMQSLVLDFGSGFSKCGFSGDDSPRALFPTISGTPKNPGIMIGMRMKDSFVGDEAQAKRGILNLTYPIERGIMKSECWNDMEKIYHHTFYNELRVTPEEHPILITEPSVNKLSNREKITSIMFELFNVPALFVASQEVLSLYTAGRVTGCVLGCGHGFTSAVSVYEGSLIHKSATRRRFGGEDITKYFAELLAKKNIVKMTTSSELEIVRDMKEKLCFIAPEKNTNNNILSEPPVMHELPDGSKLDMKDLREERFTAPESLFNPKLVSASSYGCGRGVHHMIYASIQKSDKDLRKELYSNIVFLEAPRCLKVLRGDSSVR